MGYTTENEIKFRLNEIYDRMAELRLQLVKMADIAGKDSDFVNKPKLQKDLSDIQDEIACLVNEEGILRNKFLEIGNAFVESIGTTKQ